MTEIFRIEADEIDPVDSLTWMLQGQQASTARLTNEINRWRYLVGCRYCGGKGWVAYALSFDPTPDGDVQVEDLVGRKLPTPSCRWCAGTGVRTARWRIIRRRRLRRLLARYEECGEKPVLGIASATARTFESVPFTPR